MRAIIEYRYFHAAIDPQIKKGGPFIGPPFKVFKMNQLFCRLAACDDGTAYHIYFCQNGRLYFVRQFGVF